MKIVSIMPTEETFLKVQEIPPNLLRLKPGEAVKWIREPREVVRVGYRLRANDFMDQAESLLDNDPAVLEAKGSLYRALGVSSIDKLQYAVARALAAKAGLGGRDRGILVYPCKPHDDPLRVVSTEVVKVGTYRPPYIPQCSWQGFGEGDDYEDGGLDNMRPVVLVNLSDGTKVISGDLVRVVQPKERRA